MDHRSVVTVEYGGVVVVAAVAVVCLLLLPHLVAKRTAITQSREIDRFSPGMRVLRTEDGDDRGSEGACRSPERRLLASASGHRVAGGTMSSHSEDGRRPIVGARAVHRENARIREIAQLRARRAARLANERAAGQRRLLASAATALATLVVVVLAVFSVLGWAWAALPAALLVAALATSRWAAIRSESAGRREDARLRQLREGLNAHGGRAPAGGGSAPDSDHAPEVGAGGVSVEKSSSVPGAADEGGVAAPVHVEVVAAGGSAQRVGTPDVVSVAPASAELDGHREHVGEDVATEETRGIAEPGTGTGERRAWSVATVPAPTYASRARVVGREVHADTDLRGIPAVDTTVPARPRLTGRAAEDARSTEDVIASQPVVFDLDAVLDNRRAQ
jgi:hypothetical protein